MLNPGAPTPQRLDLLRRILRMHVASDQSDILATIQSDAEFLDLPSGGVLFRQGEHSDDVYFVLSGRLRASAGDGKGGTRILGDIGRGETIGELAVFTGEPRSATITALRDSSVVKVTRATLDRALMKAPQIGIAMTRIVIERFRRSERERQTPIVPVNVCFLPITPGVDAVRFAERVREAQGASARVAMLTPADIADRFGTNAAKPVWQRYGAVADYVDQIEARSGAVYLVADPDDGPWTRFCLQYADEILLLAGANGTPKLSAIETALLAGDEPVSIARQTLVLLHPASLNSPAGTAAWLDARPKVSRHLHIRQDAPRDIARIARIVSGRGVGLVLAGGGARGFAHVGTYRALEEAGIDIDFVGGTSIGALMSMCVAFDQSAEAFDRAAQQAFLKHPRGNITGDYNWFPIISLVKGKRTREALSRAIRDAAGRRIDMEDTWKTLFVIASNFSTASENVLTRGDLARNVIASYAIPGALPPAFINGDILFDGGTFNNFPVDVMIRMGAGKIIGVDLAIEQKLRFDITRAPGTWALLRDRLRPRNKRRYPLPTIPETMVNSTFISSVAKQQAMCKLCDLLFQPRIPDVGLLEWRRYDDIVKAGYDTAKSVLAKMSDAEIKGFR
jgi:NTE family protein